MTGRLVNEGTPPPHRCSAISAPGRPNEYELNYGAVWQCECGKFWQMYEQSVTDFEGDYCGTERRWREVKDAEGTEFKWVEQPPDDYMSPILFLSRCRDHGFVLNSHRHRQRV